MSTKEKEIYLTYFKYLMYTIYKQLFLIEPFIWVQARDLYDFRPGNFSFREANKCYRDYSAAETMETNFHFCWFSFKVTIR